LIEAVTMQKRILGVGIATLDIINEVDSYPAEDDEVRALAQHRRRGGNATNTLTLLSQLGHHCTWAGTLAGDAGGTEILRDLERSGIATHACVRHEQGRTPTSCIVLSRETGSRAIVHYRDLPELTAAELARLRLWDLDWIHFEGRNPPETAAMLRDCASRCPGIPVSLEVEKPREGIDALFAGPSLLIFSRAYANSLGYADPRRFLADQWGRTRAEVLVLPWGRDGAYAQERGAAVIFAAPYNPVKIVDTLGAGDVFNAALIDGLLAGLGLKATLERANRLAGHKCAIAGFDGVVSGARSAGLL
jgi:ketohexokinase